MISKIPIKRGVHFWSGWPGCYCLKCGCDEPSELEMVGIVVPNDDISKLPCMGKLSDYYTKMGYYEVE